MKKVLKLTPKSTKFTSKIFSLHNHCIKNFFKLNFGPQELEKAARSWEAIKELGAGAGPRGAGKLEIINFLP